MIRFGRVWAHRAVASSEHSTIAKEGRWHAVGGQFWEHLARGMENRVSPCTSVDRVHLMVMSSGPGNHRGATGRPRATGTTNYGLGFGGTPDSAQRRAWAGLPAKTATREPPGRRGGITAPRIVGIGGARPVGRKAQPFAISPEGAAIRNRNTALLDAAGGRGGFRARCPGRGGDRRKAEKSLRCRGSSTRGACTQGAAARQRFFIFSFLFFRGEI